MPQVRPKGGQTGAQEQQREHPAEQVAEGPGIQDRQHPHAAREDVVRHGVHDEHQGRRGICGTPRRLFVCAVALLTRRDYLAVRPQQLGDMDRIA